jgi:hypothetical protein
VQMKSGERHGYAISDGMLERTSLGNGMQKR